MYFVMLFICVLYNTFSQHNQLNIAQRKKKSVRVRTTSTAFNNTVDRKYVALIYANAANIEMRFTVNDKLRNPVYML